MTNTKLSFYEKILKETPIQELLNPQSPAEHSNAEVSLGKGLQFITDPNLYDEIIKYFTKTFPVHANVLNKKLSFDGVMKGSNPYIAVAVDMFLKSQNMKYRIATQRDLETNLQMFKGFYEDTGLALRNFAEPNKYQVEYLYNQIKKTNPSINFPIFVNLRDLKLDSNLNFNLTPQSKYKTAECLNWTTGTKYSQVDDFGLPKTEDKNSSRQIWTTKEGLVGAYLSWNLGFYAYDGGLPDSYDNGRVVLVSFERV